MFTFGVQTGTSWRDHRSRVQVRYRVCDTLQVGIAFCVLNFFINELCCFKVFFRGYLCSNLPGAESEGLYPCNAFSIDSSKTYLYIYRIIFEIGWFIKMLLTSNLGDRIRTHWRSRRLGLRLGLRQTDRRSDIPQTALVLLTNVSAIHICHNKYP